MKLYEDQKTYIEEVDIIKVELIASLLWDELTQCVSGTLEIELIISLLKRHLNLQHTQNDLERLMEFNREDFIVSLEELTKTINNNEVIDVSN